MKAKRLESSCGQNMGLNGILYQNIISSPYFKNLYSLKTYHEVLSEIVKKVNTLEPVNKANVPTLAFVLLYKLYTLKLTIKQVNGLLNHKDSLYSRVVGLLYLRYVCKPADIWDWYEPYFEDNETMVTLSAGANPIKMSIGKICKHLILEQKWFNTLLPRIPVPIAREYEKKLKEMEAENRVCSKTYNNRQKDDNYSVYNEDYRAREFRSGRSYDSRRMSRSRERSPQDYSSRRRRSSSRDKYDTRRNERSRSRSYDRSRRRRRSRSRTRSRSRARKAYTKNENKWEY